MRRATGIIFIKKMKVSTDSWYVYGVEIHRAVYKSVAERKSKINTLVKRFNVDNKHIVLSVLPIIEIK